MVHVGVVKGLRALGLAPDLVVGASAGAVVGTLCAAGLPADEIERQALALQPWQVVRWAPRGDRAISAGGPSPIGMSPSRPQPSSGANRPSAPCRCRAWGCSMSA